MTPVSEPNPRRTAAGRRSAPCDERPFLAILAEAAPADDEALGDLIDQDGRARLAAGATVLLERYLEAVPDLALRPVALDAAIDFAMRSLVTLGSTEAEACASLKARHAALAQAIDAAREFADALTGTATIGQRGRGMLRLTLPCDVGPLSLTGKARYRLLERLGAGTQGTTYLAEDRQLSGEGQRALVCLKMLAANTADDGAPTAGEATRSRRINHPGVVRVLDRGVFHGHEYIVHEYVEGLPLGTWMARQPRRVRPEEAVRLAIRIAQGVQAAHSTGLVHRDLKPDNILITGTGEPKIADFGVAALVALDGSTQDSPGEGVPIGNLAFMAPEQFWMTAGAVAPTADIYALGGLLRFALTGQLPNGASPEAIRRRHSGVDGPPVGGDGAWLRVDQDLRAIVDRAMAAGPEHRHTSADALCADLEAWLAHRPIGWTNPTLARRAWLLIRREPLLPFLLLALLAVAALAARLVYLEAP